MQVSVDGEYRVELEKSDNSIVNVDYQQVKVPEEPRDVKNRPIAEIVVDNENGRWNGIFHPGLQVRIYRNNNLDFLGYVEPRRVENSVDSGSRMTVEVKHAAWNALEGKLCDDYDYKENGSGLADAIVNPWEWRIFRDPTEPVNEIGDFPAVEGIRPDQALEMLAGTTVIHQNFFDTLKFFVPSTIDDSSNLNLYRDERQNQNTQWLQLVYTGDNSFASSGEVESIPIYNGDPNLSPMGDVDSATIVLWGQRDSNGNNPTVEVCRNADENTRTYTSATLDSFENQKRGTLDKWTFTVDLTGDGANTKNSLGYKVSLSGDGSETTTIAYLHVVASTESDTGITSGEVEQYDDQSGSDSGNDLDDGRNFVEMSVHGQQRIDAMSEVVGMTVSQKQENPSPHWDLWFTPGMKMNFKERRGEDRDLRYSLDGDGDGDLQMIDREVEANEIYYQVYALGAGEGLARSKIVSSENFDDGGLYLPEVDPDEGAKYGEAAKEGKFDDSNIKDMSTLLRRARAFLKLHSSPIESIRADFEPSYVEQFNVGDTILLKGREASVLDDRLRVVKKEKTQRADGSESWDIQLGEPSMNVAKSKDMLQGQIEGIQVEDQPRPQDNREAEATINFTNSEAGVYTFHVNDPQDGDRWIMDVSTEAWQSDSRSAEATGSLEGENDILRLFDDGSTIDTSSNQMDLFADVLGVQEGESYDGILVTVQIFNATGSSQDYDWEVKNQTSSTTLDTESAVTIANNNSETRVYRYSTSQVSESDTVEFLVTSGTMGNDSGQSTPQGYQYLAVQTLSTHVHNLDQGIYNFDGDSGDGTGAPKFPEQVELWVDPDNLSDGSPTSSSRGKLPTKFGRETEETAITGFDITPYLEKDSEGIPKQGRHEIRVESTKSSSPNQDGVGRVSVSVNKKEAA